MITLHHHLNIKEQEQLLSLLPSKEAREQLINTNLRLVLTIAKKYSSSYFEEDLVSIGVIGLIKAIDSYSSKKNTQLSTYAYWCIKNEILMFLRKENRHLGVISLDTPAVTDPDGNETTFHEIVQDSNSTKFIESIENIDMVLQKINHISNILYTKSYRDFVLFLYMLSGKNQQIIATKFNLTQSYISRLFIKFKSVSKSYVSINSNHMVFFYLDKDNNLYLNIGNNYTLKKDFSLEAFEFFADILFKQLII